MDSTLHEGSGKPEATVAVKIVARNKLLEEPFLATATRSDQPKQTKQEDLLSEVISFIY